MNRILLVLTAITGVSGTLILILSVFLDSANYLNAGLLVLLITALLTIATVLTGHGYRRGHT